MTLSRVFMRVKAVGGERYQHSGCVGNKEWLFEKVGFLEKVKNRVIENVQETGKIACSAS
jgi:hypothetical protein